VDSKTLPEQNPPVLNWRWQLTQADVYIMAIYRKRDRYDSKYLLQTMAIHIKIMTELYRMMTQK